MQKQKLSKLINLALVLIVAGLFLVACTPTTPADTTPPSSDTTGNGNTGTSENKVSMKGMSFSPSNLTVKVGDTVTWNNDDNTTHTVTSEDDKFDSGTLSKGKTFSFTFTEAGTYSYKCELHSQMRGTITVTN